jgi:hypothetical protein
MEATCSSKTSVDFQLTTLPYISEYRNLQASWFFVQDHYVDCEAKTDAGAPLELKDNLIIFAVL